MSINNFNDLYNILPLIIIGTGIIISLIIETFSSKGNKILPYISIIIFVLAGSHSIANLDKTSYLLNNMIVSGGNAYLFNFIFTSGAAIVVLLSIDYLKKYGINYGEYYILLQISVLGMMLMASAKDLIVIFLGLELMSVPFYALAGMNRKKLKATESSLKYFLLGAFATGFLVYGIALIYGSSTTTNIDQIASNFSKLTSNILFMFGFILFIIGFSFKIAAFPFHMWVPDVYQGTSTTIAGLFSTSGKAGAFSALIVTLGYMLTKSATNTFIPYLAIISILSMFYGSIVAIAQDNLKRMLAYSSISHAGYMIIGLAAGNAEGISGIIFYLLSYTFMNLAAFGIISIVEGENDSNLTMSSYTGLASRKPLLAALMAIAMFSLAGLPPFAGFISKYYIFIAAVKANLTWLAVLGVLSSVISVYFYIRIVVLMYFKDAEEHFEILPSRISMTAVIIAIILVVALGIMPPDILRILSFSL